MKKKRAISIGVAVLSVLLVVGIIGGVKAAQIGAMIEAGESYAPPPIGVTTAEVTRGEWETTTSAIGTAVAMQAVTVASEVPGTVLSLRFESGDRVERGDILATLDSRAERAQLASARAQRDLAALTLQRAQSLIGSGAIPQADLDNASAQKAQADAAMANLQATIAKKTIRAPFSGRLGIRQANLGQILQPGAAIVQLQSVGSLYVDFQVPEQALASLEHGFAVRATSDTFPGAVFEGTIDVIENGIDPATRTVRVRALFPERPAVAEPAPVELAPNPLAPDPVAPTREANERLRPGMFLEVEVVEPTRRDVLAVPNTAVLYAPYGDSVYTVAETDGALTATQVFVRLGERRGDFVEVQSGIEEGVTVVATGAFKLSNGAPVSIENDVTPPAAELVPEPENR